MREGERERVVVGWKNARPEGKKDLVVQAR